MDNYTWKVDTIKSRFEQVMWLIGPIFVPTCVGLMFTWNLFIAPELEEFGERISGEIQGRLNAQVLSLQQVNEDHEKDITDKLQCLIH
ncbi:MAG: hypothetical protein WBW81_11900 [Methylocella sp.]